MNEWMNIYIGRDNMKQRENNDITWLLEHERIGENEALTRMQKIARQFNHAVGLLEMGRRYLRIIAN